jgi:hypothetical protein
MESNTASADAQGPSRSLRAIQSVIVRGDFFNCLGRIIDCKCAFSFGTSGSRADYPVADFDVIADHRVSQLRLRDCARRARV